MTSEISLGARLSFIKLDEKSRSALRGLGPVVRKDLPGAIEGYFSQFQSFSETRSAYRDSAAKSRQSAHLDALVSGQVDEGFARDARSVGEALGRGDIDPSYVIGAYASLLEPLIRAAIVGRWPKGFMGGKSEAAGEVAESVTALVKAALLDIDLCLAGHRSVGGMGGHNEFEAVALAAAEQERVIVALGQALGSLSEGDLTAELNGQFAKEYQSLKSDFNTAVAALREAMSAVIANTDGIRNGADEIAHASDDLSRRTEQQAASLEQTAAALDQLTATVKKSAEGARQASDVVDEAKGEAEHSGEVVRQAVAAMGEIEKSSHQISQIIGVIDEIAFQTNLLALNAGVEAARAGEAGRGFAVVAQEVRALAQRSAEAAKQIKTLISASSAQVGSGVELVGQTGDALNRIVTKVAEIDSLVSEIAASAQEQAVGLSQVNTAVNQMDQVTQQNAAMVEESTAATHTLRNEAADLIRLVSAFRIGSGAPSARPAARSAPTAAAMKHVGGRGASAVRKPEPAAGEWEEF
ncbi:globin-coupled sensor protein [Phenylobacterium montanum]|uniref:Globin-coupled sensor protein n=1 Tax=Phenylobacterium montanum TaxID=2823693 RepID=A0A975FZF8_9CAUL|nr:globin-coupled sensor protein [Caulobacter sp. S6]QUD87996.1 globin-coupled sensor protein [Caulobacter sp. S6]